MMDGSLIPIEQRPGIAGVNDYYTRKNCYALNIMAICDDRKRIRALVTGYPGAVNDQRVFDMSSVSLCVVCLAVTVIHSIPLSWQFYPELSEMTYSRSDSISLLMVATGS
jgi:hypothetical protein